MSSLGTLASRLGRHSVIYGAGTASALLLGLVQVAVLTRLLDVPEFGQLAVLLVFSTLLTVGYNLGTLQGSMRHVFGASGDEGEDGGVDVVEDDAVASSGDKRRAMGTAIAVTALVCGVCTLGLALAAPTVAELLLHDRSAATAVVWMAVSAALGSIWRLVTFALRMERRPGTYATVVATRPIFVVACVIPLAAGGGGVAGVMAGIAAGTGLSLAVALFVTRGSYRFAFDRTDAVAIVTRGWDFVPVVLGIWVINNIDVMLLSRWVPDSDIGIYRVASRVGAVMSYATAAFMMSWGPLARTPIYAAVEKEQGWKSAGATVVTYFTLGTTGLVLALTVGADLLVRLAPPSYSAAAALIPLIGLGLAAMALLLMIYRIASFPRKRLVFPALICFTAGAVVASALLLIPAYGNEGAAASLIVGPAIGLVGMLLFSQRGPSPLELQYRRMGAGIVLALACAAVAKGVGPLAGDLAPLVELVALAAFPVLLILLHVVPRGHVAALRALLRSLLPKRVSEQALAAKLETLDADDYTLLRKLVHEGRDDTDVAELFDVEPDELRGRIVTVLRQIAELPEELDPDTEIAAYLLSRGPVAERDQHARQLWIGGNDPLEIDTLVLTLQQLRDLPPWVWRYPVAGRAVRVGR